MPAIAEAFNQNIPLIIITADRPECWAGQMDNQVIPQRNLFGSFVKKSVQLPEIHTEEEEWHCNRLINEILLESLGLPSRPVHINIPLSEPLSEITEENLPHARCIRRAIVKPAASGIENEYISYLRAYNTYGKIIIIIGQGEYAGSPLSGNGLLNALHGTGCIILSEHVACGISSNCIIRNFDAIISSVPENQWGEYAPELIITFGRHIVSKQIKKFLRKNKPVAHWHLSEYGEIVDTYQCLSDVIEIAPDRFIDMLIRGAASNSERSLFVEKWSARSSRLPIPVPAYSDIMAVGEFMKNIPDLSKVFLGNSMSVRLALLFPTHAGKDVNFYANRGVSGIDGAVSTAIGIAAAEECPERCKVFLVIGDLSFYYDINAVQATAFRGKNLRILLNNNGGGEIFHTLPGYEQSAVSDNYIVARRRSSAKEWAVNNNFTYLSANNEDELCRCMKIFVDPELCTSSILLEVFTDMEANVVELNKYYRSIRKL
jgi:2-succinyl-5-enolpyruvyl-6-hydroxy-3-cyclohexene-1-carboxylate synthase